MSERIVRILDTFSPDRTAQTSAEIARRAGLSSSTCHRLIADLVGQGLLERDGAGRIRLGLRLWELALRGSATLRLRQAAMPAMQRVLARLGEHIQLAVLERGEALFLERLSSPDAGANITRIAGRLPLHASSSGLALLAYADEATVDAVCAAPLQRLASGTITSAETLRHTLAQIRREGSVIAPASVEDVSTGVAVPVRAGGRVIAALSAVLPIDRPLTGVVETLRAGASAIASAHTRAGSGSR